MVTDDALESYASINDDIEELMADYDRKQRASNGRDIKKKNYAKITISVTEQNKLDIENKAKSKGVSVSQLIKELFRDTGVIGESWIS